MRTKMNVNGVEVWRIDNGVNGNPRYVMQFSDVPYTGEDTEGHISHACQVLGGKRYQAKWFGGGIVFTSYNIDELIKEKTK